MRRLLPWLFVLLIPVGRLAADSADKLKGDDFESKLVPALIEKLHDTDPDVRRQAAWALGHLGSPAAPALVQALRDSKVRLQAVEALKQIGNEAVPPLLKALQDENDTMRQYAVYTLASIAESWVNFGDAFPRDAKSRAVVVKAMKDRKEYVRELAGVVVEHIGSYALLELLPLLKDKDDDTRARAAWALGSMAWRYTATKNEALVPLADLLHDKNKKVRSTALRAINRGLESGGGDSVTHYVVPAPPKE